MKGKATLCLFNAPFKKIFLNADEKGDSDPEPEGFLGMECFSFNYYEKERKLKEINQHRALIILLPSFVRSVKDLH